MSSPLDSPEPPARPSSEAAGRRQDLPLADVNQHIRTTRYERSTFAKADLPHIAKRVRKFVQSGYDDRKEDNELRKQREAKMRMWTEGRTWPWDDASDAAIPDMLSNQLAVEDGLTNAVLATRPSVVCKAVNDQDRKHESDNDHLLDYQLFVEQDGEGVVGQLAQAFPKDGRFTAMVSYVREDRETTDIHLYDERPPNRLVLEYHGDLIDQRFPQKETSRPVERFGGPADGWDWEVVDRKGNRYQVSFYTEKTMRRGQELVQTKMKVTHHVNVFDGPKVRVIPYHRVLFPKSASNLQMPGPSNPNGAAHVVIVDFPTLDELIRDTRSGFYDLVTLKQINALKSYRPDSRKGDETGHEEMLDDMAGLSDSAQDSEPTHRKFTRYTCFDLYDLNGDGVNEDVVWWTLREKDLVLKAAPLGELFPSRKPMRPLAEAVYLPVEDKAIGISLLEIVEGLHDTKKELFDLMIDSGTLATMPYGFYKPTSTLTPVTLRPGPGDLIPTSNPKDDLFFPNLGNANQVFALNGMTVLERWEQDLTLQGDLQRGRIPAGRSAALRTSGGIAQVLAQGEARPERILRRFFKGITSIYRLMHEANRHFLRDNKRIRIVGRVPEGESPYALIKRAQDLDIDVDFEFQASILSASKVARQEALEALLQVYVQPLTIQAGIIDAAGIRRLLIDWSETRAIDGEQYLVQAPPDFSLPRITWREAVADLIATNRLPEAVPAEDPVEHLQGLAGFAQSEEFKLLLPNHVELFRQWWQRAMEYAQRQQLTAAAGQPGLIAPGGGQRGGEPNVEPAGEVLQASQPSDGRMPAATGTGQ